MLALASRRRARPTFAVQTVCESADFDPAWCLARTRPAALATVLMACRSIERCDDAKEAIEEDHGDEAGSVEVLQVRGQVSGGCPKHASHPAQAASPVCSCAVGPQQRGVDPQGS